MWLWHDVTHVETTTHERSGISCGTGPDHALGPVVVGVLTGLYIGLTDDACGVSPVAPDPLLSISPCLSQMFFYCLFAIGVIAQRLCVSCVTALTDGRVRL